MDKCPYLLSHLSGPEPCLDIVEGITNRSGDFAYPCRVFVVVLFKFGLKVVLFVLCFGGKQPLLTSKVFEC